ncbi:hypothetical protein BJ878DRAFT_518677 [Calycina marina]|uniref:Uncharacterized protein n=1 Tax=Calycina marina TaxID=1763456 RepID=A0A9P8CCP3_9HELO|nr:hypothetical protein BJ878DRAFT_518677 [Calycina marina]
MADTEKMKQTQQKELDEMNLIIAKTEEEQNQADVKALELHYQNMLGEVEKTLRGRRLNKVAVRSLTESINALENEGMFAAM